MGGGFPNPIRPDILSDPRSGNSLVDQFFGQFVGQSPQATPQDTPPGPPLTVFDLYLELGGEDSDDAIALLTDFYAWSIGTGVSADPNDPALSQRYLAGRLPGAAPGGVGRVQFESERALDLATAQLREQQAQTEAFQREALRQQAASEAFSRVKDKFDLLMATDQLADARREAAVNALISAAPFMVNPGQQFTPGFEQFGVGQQLGNLLGANVPAQQLPTAQLPLNELANPPLNAPPQDIIGGLDPFLSAPGPPQI